MAADNEHDLLVIGAGPGGYVAAIRAAQLGWNVACVEKEPQLGGTCLRIGCIPSKALLDSSHLFASLKELTSHGISAGGVELDLATMMRRKEQVVSTLTRGIEHLFKKNKVSRYWGTASIVAPGRVRVEGKDSKEILAKNILIATGSKPAGLPGVEVDGHRIGTSTEALSYGEVPKHLVVIGAGSIGLEMGAVWSRLGSKVTLLEYLPRILPGMDEEIAAEAKKIFQKQGLEFRLGVKVKSARRKKEGCVVEYEGGSIECDRVLLAAGRVPNTEGLGTEKIGLKLDSRGRLEVNENFECSVPGILAIGDVIRGPMLAHKAEEEGVACVERLITGFGHVDYNTIPGVCYTHPEVASVGETEQSLQEKQVEYRKGSFPFQANGRARAMGEVDGKVKVLADAATDRILGVHIVGPHAGDLINEAAAAMQFGASSEDLGRVCHAHPTFGEALREAAMAASSQPLHL